MSSTYVFALLCIQACLVQTVFSQCCGPRFSLGSLNLAPSLGNYGSSTGSYGGSGQGNVGVAGELPVAGTTCVAGTVPVIGTVHYYGEVPAAGCVTIAGDCSGCRGGPGGSH